MAIAQHAILRFAKHKAGPAGALEAHHERTKEQYASNPDIDTSRSKYNFHIIRPAGKYRREIDSRIVSAGCRTRKDSTMFVDTLITASPEFFKGRKREEIKAFFTEAVSFMERKIGKGNIFSAVVHLDEKTPHLHLCFTPITQDRRLSAKDILGNRGNLSKWQDEFHAHMKKQFSILKRGKSSLVTRRRHIPTWLFKQSVDLSKQQKAIEQILTDMNPMNTGKKRAEALALLSKFFPKAEAHMGQMNKYKATLDYLAQENASLKKEVERNKGSIKNQLNAAQMQSEYENMKRFVDSISPEMMREIKMQQRGGRGKDGIIR
jgi:hypothetical protein